MHEAKGGRAIGASSALRSQTAGHRLQELQGRAQAVVAKTIKKMVIGTYILIITLNVNGLNAPTKRHRPDEWIQKQDPYICCLQGTHFRPRDTYRLKVKGWKKRFHASENQKKAGVAILI